MNKILHRLDVLFRARRTTGVAIGLAWYAQRLLQNFGICPVSPWNVQPPGLDFPLTVQRGQTSDLRVFEQIFVLQEYACLRDLPGVRNILDLGANVGFSSAWLLSAFSGARVVAVEPFAPNFAALEINMAPYGQRAHTLHGAVWSHCGRLRMHADDASGWAKQVEQTEDDRQGEIQAWDVPALMEIGGMETVDLLKVDIEGAEAAVFNDAARQWLQRVRNICIELHGRECSAAFFRSLEGFDYDLTRSEELTICRNLRPRQP